MAKQPSITGAALLHELLITKDDKNVCIVTTARKIMICSLQLCYKLMIHRSKNISLFCITLKLRKCDN